MVLRAALLALAIGFLPASSEPATATDAIPDEPGAIVLPAAPILQAVAADLDGDGSRELVRLVLRAGRAPFAEVWALDDGRLRLIGDAVDVLPEDQGGPRGVQAPEAEPVETVALRLIVHRVGEREHVVVASQPRFDELETGYRLELHDLVVEAGAVRRVPVAQPADPVDGILAIDLDGDGTDELLTARSLAPLGGISFRTDARVLRWTDAAFGTPTRSELPIGSGDTPFILGDSDGRPGEEVAIISTLGAPGLYRIALGPADTLGVEEFGAAVSGARGVPLPGGGIAVVARGEVSVHRWPAFGPPAPAEASVAIAGAELIGVVDMAKTRLLVHEPGNHSLHLLALPALAAIEGGRLTESLAARTLSEVSVASYVGPLPGGGPDGVEAVIFAGSYLPSPPGATFLNPFPSATFAGAEPVGLVGDRDWIAILHAAPGTPLAAPGGGRFVPLEPRVDAWLSVVPLASVLLPAVDGGVLEPPLSGAMPIVDGLLATGRGGFVAEIRAPAGSRVHVLGPDASDPGERFTVPAPGRLELPVSLPDAHEPNEVLRVDGLVLTPAGHAYAARWDVLVLTEPPPLEVDVVTPFGSSEVLVSGRTPTFASVMVNGRPVALSDGGRFSARVSLPPWPTDVEVIATDFVGHSSRAVVSGVGILDYRTLPWVPIVAVLVAAAGAILFMRVPQPAGERPRMDDAVLEEIDSD